MLFQRHTNILQHKLLAFSPELTGLVLGVRSKGQQRVSLITRIQEPQKLMAYFKDFLNDQAYKNNIQELEGVGESSSLFLAGF